MQLTLTNSETRVWNYLKSKHLDSFERASRSTLLFPTTLKADGEKTFDAIHDGQAGQAEGAWLYMKYVRKGDQN